jgi:SWI/SNF-related matrix-associated actin-dependent regulator 1 of chromatin subfamily A
MKVELLGEKSWVARSSYEERAIPKEAGFRWNPAQEVWWTDDAEKAKKLQMYADEETIASINKMLGQKIAAIENSRAVSSNLDIPVPEGLMYRPFQRAGIAYCNERKNSLIADEMGLGKTIQAIGFINLNPDIEKVLVICPATLKLNWKREMEKWLVSPFPFLSRKRSIEVIDGSGFSEQSNIIIINYEMVRKYSKEIKSINWDLMICDESHYLKNPKAQRTQEILGYKEIPAITAKRKIFLTGTPVLNRPIELHPLLRSLEVEFARSWRYYVLRYCNGQETRYGWDVSGSCNTEELGKKLRETIMVRREKSQVLKELPEKTHQLITLAPDGFAPQINKEQKAWAKHEEKTKEMKDKIAELRNSGKTDTEEYRLAVQNLRAGALADFTEIAKLRHETAIKKLPSVVEMVSDAAENEGSVVVFAHHTDVLDGIVEGIRKAGFTAEKLDGSTSMEKRQQIVDDFQAGKINVFVGGMKAAGVGITLTKASHVIFAELDWTPATIAQAEDRLHRIGQINNVLVQHIVFDGSIDSMLAKKLIDKEEIIESILD